jgi:hypothetical protein
VTAPLPGIPATERRIDQRECATKGCAWEGQRWDALSAASGDACPECHRKGKSTGIKAHVGDGETLGGGRIVEVSGPSTPEGGGR